MKKTETVSLGAVYIHTGDLVNIDEDKGITILALVITIIILLILVGVTIAMLTGNNGILTQAKSAKTKNEKVEVLEEVKLETSGSFDYDGKYNVNKAIYNLKNNLNINGEQIVNKNGILIITYKGYKLYIDTKGKVSEGLTASIIENDPQEYYGKIVSNYECENQEAVKQWKIFYADSENIYLVAGNPITNIYVPNGRKGTPIGVGTINTSLRLSPYQDYIGSEDILKNAQIAKWLNWLKEYPESTNDNIRAVAYLLDMQTWQKFKGDNADYAVGGVTLDLFVSSYNQKHPEKKLEYTMKYGLNGYRAKFIDDVEYKFLRSGLETDAGLYSVGFLASPYAHSNGTVWIGYVNNGTISCSNMATGVFIKPLVCLKQNVELEQLDSETFFIREY